MLLNFASILLTVLTLFSAFPAQSALKGTVVDSSGGAVADVHIVIHRSGGPGKDVLVSTTKDGKYVADLSPGIYDVFVAAVGFDPACAKIKVTRDRTVERKFTLSMSHVENIPD